MRLLHIIRSVNPADGGPVEGIWRQAAATATAGMAVDREVVTLDMPDAPFLANAPLPVHAVGDSPPAWAPDKFDNYGDPRPMARWLRDEAARFDCAIVHGLWNGATAAARMALPNGQLPYFVFTHGMLDRWFALAYPWKHRAKQMSWSLVEGPLLAGARAVLFTAEEERRGAQGLFRGHPYRGVQVDYGTEPLVRDDSAPPGNRNGPLLFLGRIHRKKGLDMLIEAMGKLPGDECPSLIVVGPDQEGRVPALSARAAELGIAKKIEWRGPVYGAGKAAVMREAGAFVLPSHQENFGIAVAEAMSMGVPVLLSDKVAIWREIEAAGAGLIAPDTIEGTLRLLRDWSAQDLTSREKMSRKAQLLFNNRFDVRRTGPGLIEWIKADLRQR
jgi:glycosyltransferase involved in cell wall biosynthesis